MGSEYKPRDGDVVKITATVKVGPTGTYVPYMYGSISFPEMVRRGEVELVSRAEPDWRVGDIGVDEETGLRYAYLRPERGEPWRLLSAAGGLWHKKKGLRRMRLVPEDEA